MKRIAPIVSFVKVNIILRWLQYCNDKSKIDGVGEVCRSSLSNNNNNHIHNIVKNEVKPNIKIEMALFSITTKIKGR